MYRKILVAYNGTPESRSALDEAVRMAPDPSVEVHLAGVVNYPSAYLLAGEYVPEVALADERDHMDADLKSAHTLLSGKGLKVTDHLLVGEPVDVLSKLVEELGCDLLILGHPLQHPHRCGVGQALRAMAGLYLATRSVVVSPRFNAFSPGQAVACSSPCGRAASTS